MNDLALVLAGALLCNCIPHLTKGLQGEPFPSPFAKPRGVGDSSAMVNFLWGAFNLAAGVALLVRFPLRLGLNLPCLVFAAGFLGLGIYLSGHFAKVRAGRAA